MKTKLVVAALTLAFVTPAFAADQAEKKKEFNPRVTGGAIAVGSAAAAFATRDVNLYRDALTPQPMDDAKAERVMKATDELLEKSDTSKIPNRGPINKARIAIKDLHRPQVTITLDTNQMASPVTPSSALADEAADALVASRKVDLKTVGAKLLTRQNQTRMMDVRRDGGRAHLESQVKALKEERTLVPAASVHSAGRRMANKLAKAGVAGGAVLALGASAKDLLELNLTEKDLQSCNEAADGSLSCSRVAKERRQNSPASEESPFAQNAK